MALLQRPLQGQDVTPVDPRSFVHWRERARLFEALAIAQVIPVDTMGVDNAEGSQRFGPRLRCSASLALRGQSAGFLVMMMRAQRPAANGESLGASSTVLLSHDYWQQRFGADPGVLGRSIAIGRGFATVIGVLPAGFRVATLNVGLYLPLPLDPNKPEAVGSRAFECFGRLRPNTTIQQARAEMA